MGIIFWKIIADRKVSTIIYCVAAIAMLLMYVAMFPTIAQQTAAFTEAFENYPDALWKAFGVESLSFDRLENFLAMEQFGVIWPVMVIFLVASFASHSLAREIEKGTAEILLARPVSRRQIFLGRYLAGLAVLFTFTVLSTVTVAPLATALTIEFQFPNYLATALVGFLFGWAFLSIAFACSAFFSEKSKVAMVIGGLAIVMYVLKLVASLIDSLDWLKYLSFFHYFNANDTLIAGKVELLPLVIFGCLIIVTTVIGVRYFEKRDIAV